MKDLDIGQMIKREADRQRYPYSCLARDINCSRSALYNIFNSRDISLGRLIALSNALQHDFIGDIQHALGSESGHDPYIAIPFKHGDIDLSELPQDIIRFLKDRLDVQK